jgi:hypothetical protein
MQQSNSPHPTTYHHQATHPLPHSSSDISTIGSGTFATDVVHLGFHNDFPSHRIIRGVKHPLTDSDLVSDDWTKQQLKQLRYVLVNLDSDRKLFWSGQPVDAGRFGMRESMARQYSIGVVEKAIGRVERRERRTSSLGERGGCLVM